MLSFREYIKIEIFDNQKYSIIQLLKRIINCPHYEAVFLIRAYLVFYNKHEYRRLAKFFQRKLISKYGIFVSHNTKIGIGLKLPHPNGIIFGAGVEIGCNNIIYQQVTFGGANIGDSRENKYPTTRDNCVFFAGAKVLGQIIIEENTTLGANSVLITSTISNSVYAGVPALLKKCKEN